MKERLKTTGCSFVVQIEFLYIDVPILQYFNNLSYKSPLEREPHVAHLISLGFTPVEIAERLGHEGISVTYTYSHLYPSKQRELADKLDADHGSEDVLDGLTEGNVDEIKK